MVHGDDEGEGTPYAVALAWLYGRQSLGIKLGLDKVHRLLAGIGDPHRRFESVHVAGTNGKGSVTRLLGETLRRAGHRTGCFTSPHLVHFTERITVDGERIPAAAVVEGLEAIRPVVEALDDDGVPPTFFEINTALAFWWFARQGVAWAVVETGMGGRLDATNVVMPRLTVITNIDIDHASFLGHSIADITFEKAGIMKQGVPCITGARGDALAALKAVSRDRHVPMSVLGEDYHVLPDINGLRLAHPGGEAHYDLALAGEHQLDNAALVVAAADALRGQGVRLPEPALQQALAQTTVPGRLETLHIEAEDGARKPVLLDAAHNPAGARALRYHLGRIDWTGFSLIVGFSSDKDWPAMLDQWVPLASHVYGVPLRSDRSLEPERMREHVEAAGFPFSACRDAADALARAQASDAPAVVVAGSVFLVGEARARLLGESLEEIRGRQ